jgi:hypothetical protein
LGNPGSSTPARAKTARSGINSPQRTQRSQRNNWVTPAPPPQHAQKRRVLETPAPPPQHAQKRRALGTPGCGARVLGMPTHPFRLACARLQGGLTYCAPTALHARQSTLTRRPTAGQTGSSPTLFTQVDAESTSGCWDHKWMPGITSGC